MRTEQMNEGQHDVPQEPAIYPKHVPSAELLTEIMKLGWRISDGNDMDGSLAARRDDLNRLADMEVRPVLPEGMKVVQITMALGVYPWEYGNPNSVMIATERKSGYTVVSDAHFEGGRDIHYEDGFNYPEGRITYITNGVGDEVTILEDPEIIDRVRATFAETPEESVAKAVLEAATESLDMQALQALHRRTRFSHQQSVKRS